MPLPLRPCSVLAAFLLAVSCAAQLPADLPPAAAEAYRKAADAEQQSFFDIALEKYQAALKLAPTPSPAWSPSSASTPPWVTTRPRSPPPRR